MKIDPLAAVARVALWLALSQAATAWAADIKVLSTPTLKSTLAELGPQFERTSGHRLLIKYDSAAALKRQIEAGEAFDVTILLPPLIDDLQKQILLMQAHDIGADLLLFFLVPLVDGLDDLLLHLIAAH